MMTVRRGRSPTMKERVSVGIRSVPGAVATGFRSKRHRDDQDDDPIATATGTDLITRRTLTPSDMEPLAVASGSPLANPFTRLLLQAVLYRWLNNLAGVIPFAR